MRDEFRNLRLKQLDRALKPFRAAAKNPRPQKGWLRAIREAAGISASEVARTLKTSRQLPVQLEKAEAEDRITLRSLRAAANALGCELVYALVPRASSLHELVEERAIWIIDERGCLPFVRIPFRVLIDREGSVRAVQRNYPLARKIAGALIEFPERPERKPLLRPALRTSDGHGRTDALVKRPLFGRYQE